jgi:hypothetical protein
VKNKLVSLVFGAVGVIILIASLYYTISYLSYVGGVVIEFLSTNNVREITDCGVNVPYEFIEIRDQFPSTILPTLYLGLPVILILISVSMFVSGYFFGKHKLEMEIEGEISKQEEIEREVERRTGKKKPEARKEEPAPQEQKPKKRK